MKNFFEKAKTLGKEVGTVSAFMLLANLPGFAQSRENNQDKAANELKELARINESKIVLEVETKGQAGKFGNTEVKKWVSPDGKQLLVGYDNQGKARWLITENDECLIVDKDLNGSAERVITNKSNDPKDNKIAFNEAKAFTSWDELTKDAETEADLMPQDVKVYDIENESDKTALKVVNFATGKTEESVGDEAGSHAKVVQGVFTNEMEKLAAELGK